MNQDYTYGVARVRAREAALLGRADLERLVACPTQEDCLRVLQEKGWGPGEGNPSPQEMLAAEEEKTWGFLGELTRDPAPFAPLLVPMEGNNLKAAIKCAVTGARPSQVFLPGGRWDPQDLLRWAEEGDFSRLPQGLAQAADQARQALLQTGDGQLCDVLVDRACLEEVLRLGEESGLPALAAYCRWTVATADIQTAARACAAGKNREFFRLALAPCPTLDTEELTDAALRGREKLLEFLAATPYSQGAKLLARSFPAFEKWRDDQGLELLKGEKNEYFTAGPLVAYAVARRREIDTVRVILSGKRNGLDEGKIRERLRETYV